MNEEKIKLTIIIKYKWISVNFMFLNIYHKMYIVEDTMIFYLL